MRRRLTLWSGVEWSGVGSSTLRGRDLARDATTRKPLHSSPRYRCLLRPCVQPHSPHAMRSQHEAIWITERSDISLPQMPERSSQKACCERASFLHPKLRRTTNHLGHRMFKTTLEATLGRLWMRTYMLKSFYLTDHIATRSEFMKNMALDKKDFSAIEYLLRRGQRQLEIYASPGIRNILR